MPNEQVKRRLEGEATFIAQEWGEMYSREKSRLIRGQFEDLRSSLERDIEGLDKEWTEVNHQFSTQGYSGGLHERYQVQYVFAYLPAQLRFYFLILSLLYWSIEFILKIHLVLGL